MKGLFDREEFAGLGPSRYQTAGQVASVTLVEAERVARLRTLVRQECHRCPGIYGMLNGKAELIYVGKSKNLRSRILSYFRPGKRDRRVRRIVRQTRALVWEPGPHELAALLRELELIRRWRPRFNIVGQPLARRRLFVCVGRQPAPYCFLSSQPAPTVLTRFGPVPAGKRTREAVRHLNDWYRLRDCPQSQAMAFAEQGELFPVLRTPGCLRHDLGTCLAPCASACTRRDYQRQVRGLERFLAGEHQEPIEALTRTMIEASRSLRFEQAAALRDQVARILWLDQMLDRIRTTAELSFVYPARTPTGQEIWYLIVHGQVRGILPRPTREADRRRAIQTVKETYKKSLANRTPTIEEMDSVLLVSSWFRKFPNEKPRGISPEAALQLLRQTISAEAD